MQREKNLPAAHFILPIWMLMVGCTGAATLTDTEATSPDLGATATDGNSSTQPKPPEPDEVALVAAVEVQSPTIGLPVPVPAVAQAPKVVRPKMPRRAAVVESSPALRRALHSEPWTLPLPMAERAHPLGDEVKGSVSVGSTTQGYLANQRRFPASGPNHRVLQEHQHRNTSWGTDEMVLLLQKAAEAVAKKMPGSILMVGNIAQAGGGDMPWSVSHNSGRDVDLAYYVLDASGHPYQPTTLVTLDAKGNGLIDGRAVKFDAARTWALVKELVYQKEAPVQYVFAYEPLIKSMLEVAKKEGLTREQEKALRLVLRQPRGAQPHVDHMHVRISCSEEDLSLGCRDMVAGAEIVPRQNPGYQSRVAEMLARVQEKGASGDRLSAAWRTLGLLRAGVEKRLFLEAVASCADPLCGALLETGTGLRITIPMPSLVGIIQRSDDLLTVREAFRRLRHSGGGVVKVAEELLGSTKVLVRSVGPGKDQLSVQVEALHLLGWSGVRTPRVFEGLLEALSSSDVRVRQAAGWSLAVLLAAEFVPSDELLAGPVADAAARWKTWHRNHRDPAKNLREALVKRGFKLKGKKRLETVDLLKAVELEDSLSMQAQRMLAEVFKVDKGPDLLHKRDARRYWKSQWNEAGGK